MEQRKALDVQASGLMIVLCMIWGIQQVVLKLAAPDISPIMQIAIRSGLSALLVFPLILLQQGVHLCSKAYLLPGIWLALLFSAEFLLVAEALRYTTASHAVVLLYTAPIFVALGLHWKLPAEKLNAVQWLGIFMAFGGIALSFIGRGQHAGQQIPQALWGDFLALLAGGGVGIDYHFTALDQTGRCAAHTDLILSAGGRICVFNAGRCADWASRGSLERHRARQHGVSCIADVFFQPDAVVLAAA